MWAGCDRQTWRKRSSPIMPPRRTVHAAQWMIVCVRVCVYVCLYACMCVCVCVCVCV